MTVRLMSENTASERLIMRRILIDVKGPTQAECRAQGTASTRRPGPGETGFLGRSEKAV